MSQQTIKQADAAKRWLSPADVAGRLGVSEDWVRKACKAGEISSVALSGTVRHRWRISAEALDEYLQKRTRVREVQVYRSLRRSSSLPVRQVFR